MKKLSLIVTLLLAVLLLQKCKKDSYTADATSSNTLFAVINDTTWSADTITAAVTYNSLTKSKTFTCTGLAKNKEVNLSVKLVTSGNTPGFPLSTFNADSLGNNLFSYYTYEKNSSGANVFFQQGTVGIGSGTITFTAVDSVKKVMTGIFSLVSEHKTYDSSGNLLTVTINEVAAGAFNNLPYTYNSN